MTNQVPKARVTSDNYHLDKLYFLKQKQFLPHFIPSPPPLQASSFPGGLVLFQVCPLHSQDFPLFCGRLALGHPDLSPWGLHLLVSCQNPRVNPLSPWRCYHLQASWVSKAVVCAKAFLPPNTINALLWNKPFIRRPMGMMSGKYQAFCLIKF